MINQETTKWSCRCRLSMLVTIITCGAYARFTDLAQLPKFKEDCEAKPHLVMQREAENRTRIRPLYNSYPSVPSHHDEKAMLTLQII